MSENRSVYAQKGGKYPREYWALFEQYRLHGYLMHSDQLNPDKKIPEQVFFAINALAGEYWGNGNMNWDASWQTHVDTVWNDLVPGYYDDSINEEERGSIADWPHSIFDAETIEQIKQDLRAINVLGYGAACRLTSKNEVDIVNALSGSNAVQAFVRLIDRTIEWIRSRDNISTKGNEQLQSD